MKKRMERLEKEVAEFKEKVAAGTTTDVAVQGIKISPDEFNEILKNAPVQLVSDAKAERIN